MVDKRRKKIIIHTIERPRDKNRESVDQSTASFKIESEEIFGLFNFKIRFQNEIEHFVRP